MTEKKSMDIKKTLIMLLAPEPGLDDPERVRAVPFPFARNEKADYGKARFFDALPLTHRSFTLEAEDGGTVVMKHNISPAAYKCWEEIGDEFTQHLEGREAEFTNADVAVTDLLKSATADFRMEASAALKKADDEDESS